MQQRIYDELSSLEDKHWWFLARRSYIARIISKFYGSRKPDLDKPLNFCEIGCGTGGNLTLLSKYSNVRAIEMNEPARQIANKKDVTLVQSGHLPDTLPFDFKKAQFDGVFALDVIEHVQDDIASLKALKKLLAENGFLITTVPAYQWLWSEHDVANHHFRRYTKNEYCALFKNAGYEICYASYFNTLLFPLAVIDRVFSTARKNPIEEATITMPSNFINKILRFVFGLESTWAGKVTMPFGLSIMVVAKLSE